MCLKKLNKKVIIGDGRIHQYTSLVSICNEPSGKICIFLQVKLQQVDQNDGNVSVLISVSVTVCNLNVNKKSVCIVFTGLWIPPSHAAWYIGCWRCTVTYLFNLQQTFSTFITSLYPYNLSNSKIMCSGLCHRILITKSRQYNQYICCGGYIPIKFRLSLS